MRQGSFANTAAILPAACAANAQEKTNGEGSMFSKGKIYRFGIAVKEFGERIGRLPVLRWFCKPVIRRGLAIKESVNGCPVKEM
jgi:hypothetical protein